MKDQSNTNRKFDSTPSPKTSAEYLTNGQPTEYALALIQQRSKDRKGLNLCNLGETATWFLSVATGALLTLAVLGYLNWPSTTDTQSVSSPIQDCQGASQR